MAARPCARRRSPRAKVAQGVLKNAAVPACVVGACLHAGAFKLFGACGDTLRCFKLRGHGGLSLPSVNPRPLQEI